jgi:predicted phage baseplate assembly protein
VRGARLPTGVENIRAKYRSGIGKAGNVKAGQVSLLAARPLGVKSVVNPLRASGGADKETRDQARATAPLSTLALDRLVSVQDYADFARMFAGIGKASAARLSDGQRLVVHVTIAGVDDIPIDLNSDLFQNLRLSLRQYGDPYFPVRVALRNVLALVISANIRLLPDYLWEDVERRVRARLLDTFGFDRRDLGQPTYLSEVIGAIQSVMGVAYVDIDLFDGVPEPAGTDDLAKLSAELARLAANPAARPYVQPLLARPNRAFDPAEDTPDRRILPAQLAYLTPAVPDTVILKELTS